MAYSQSHYKRTVRCSYCYERGHNKSGCPKYAAKIEKIRQESGDDHYAVAAYDAKKAKRKAKAKDRKCSYCDGKGHNRATCPELRANILKSQAKTAVFRKAMYERMKALGVGVGTVISTDRFRGLVDENDYNSARYRVPHVITAINWNNIAHFNTDYSYFDESAPWLSKPLCRLDVHYSSEPGWVWDNQTVKLIMGEELAEQWIDDSHWRAKDKMNYFCDVESPVRTPEPPAKWLLGGDLKFWKRAYKKRNSWEGAL